MAWQKELSSNASCKLTGHALTYVMPCIRSHRETQSKNEDILHGHLQCISEILKHVQPS